MQESERCGHRNCQRHEAGRKHRRARQGTGRDPTEKAMARRNLLIPLLTMRQLLDEAAKAPEDSRVR
jgi:hypothetical protein